jgi:hypothetical protein
MKNKSKHPCYYLYLAMIQRCTNPKVKNYNLYGAKGVTVCDRWIGTIGFENFLADMGERPKGFQLDRINGNKGYSPENCRWASTTTQSINRSKFKNGHLQYKGVTRNKPQKDGTVTYKARTSYKKHEYVIGTFKTELEAAKAYDAEVFKLYGTDAVLNFPEDYPLNAHNGPS